MRRAFARAPRGRVPPVMNLEGRQSTVVRRLACLPTGRACRAKGRSSRASANLPFLPTLSQDTSARSRFTDRYARADEPAPGGGSRHADEVQVGDAPACAEGPVPVSCALDAERRHRGRVECRGRLGPEPCGEVRRLERMLDFDVGVAQQLQRKLPSIRHAVAERRKFEGNRGLPSDVEARKQDHLVRRVRPGLLLTGERAP